MLRRRNEPHTNSWDRRETDRGVFFVLYHHHITAVAFAFETKLTIPQMIARALFSHHIDCTNILELGDRTGNRYLAWSFGRFIPLLLLFGGEGRGLHA